MPYISAKTTRFLRIRGEWRFFTAEPQSLSSGVKIFFRQRKCNEGMIYSTNICQSVIAEKIVNMVSIHRLFFLVALIVAGCNSNEQPNELQMNTDTLKVNDPVIVTNDSVQKQPVKLYANDRFKEVSVMKTAAHSFLIKGKAQIFEANLSWVVEDGHEELTNGFQTADAGAPEWGNFTFSITVAKKRPNSTLHLILFESSAKDGSRQHELPILLY